MKMWDKGTDEPELPRQFYLHHRHQERPLSSYPFRFMGKREVRGSKNADKSKLEASETEWSVTPSRMWRKYEEGWSRKNKRGRSRRGSWW